MVIVTRAAVPTFPGTATMLLVSLKTNFGMGLEEMQ